MVDMDMDVEYILGTLLIGLGFPIVISLAIGILWMPAAASISALIAKNRGMDVGELAKIGALCSALFFVPWIYLILRIYNVNLSHWIICIIYALLYVAWIIIPTGFLVLIIFDVKEGLGPTSDGLMPILQVFVLTVVFITLVLCMVTWLFSLRALLRHHRETTSSMRFSTSGQLSTSFYGKPLTMPCQGATFYAEDLWEYLKPWMYFLGWLTGIATLMFTITFLYTSITGYTPF